MNLPRLPLLLALTLLSCRGPSGASPGVERYGDGLFTTPAWDFFMAFTPDQRRVLFCRADDAFQRYEVLETIQDAKGHWSTPAHPRFAAEWSNADPHFSLDGRTVYFISNRPNPGETSARATYDVWSASLGEDGAWSDARRLPSTISDPTRDEWSPSVAANGNLYFGSDRPGGLGGSDLWLSRLVDGAYQEPENLGAAINTAAAHEVEPWIAPDERYLIFSALRRPDGLGGYDLYLSRRGDDGRWQPARHLPEGINSRASDYNQSVSPDGKWLYFSSSREGTTGDIFRVPMSALGL